MFKRKMTHSSMSERLRGFGRLKILLTFGAVLVASTALVATASAVKNSGPTVTYGGQGLWADGFGGYDLNIEKCDHDNNGVLEDGADAEGPYLLWVFTAQGATSATITGPWGTANMTQVAGSKGTFKYISDWYEPSTLPGNVTATYGGGKNAQLTISHGCRPFNPEKPVWCSPGFWKNATTVAGVKPNNETYPGAWPLTGHTPSDTFNTTVVSSNFYDTPYTTFKIGNGQGATFITDDPNTPLVNEGDPTLQQVLANGQGGVNSTVSGPLGLDQFNATGAFLTDSLEGYSFSSTDQAAGSDTCPIDSFGIVKPPDVPA